MQEIFIREATVWEFVFQLEKHMQDGWKVKDYDSVAFAPAFDGVQYGAWLVKAEEQQGVAEEVSNVAEQNTAEEKSKRQPPVRKPKQVD